MGERARGRGREGGGKNISAGGLHRRDALTRGGLLRQFFLAETKKNTFERVRGEAEKIAREFEGGKVVLQSMRDLYEDLRADLQRRQEATRTKRVLHSCFQWPLAHCPC